jgi:hypothetical protein
MGIDVDRLEDWSVSYPVSTSGILGNLAVKSSPLTLSGLSSCLASVPQKLTLACLSYGPGVSGPVSEELEVRSKIEVWKAAELEPLAISREDSLVLRTISASISRRADSSDCRDSGITGPFFSNLVR